MYRISIYRELDPMPEQRTKFAFKGKREHIAKVNISNLANSNQHVDTETSDDSRDTVTVSDTVKITFNLDIESNNKKWSTAKIVGQALVKKKVLMLGSKNVFKAWVGAKKADGMTITVTTQENVLKNVFVERFAIPLDFDFFKHPICPYRFKIWF